VTADTLEQAVEQLQELQEKAQDECKRQDLPDNMESMDYDDTFKVLDPEEVVDGDSGITLIDENGKRLRDLEGVPTGCPQLGEPLEA
jgi:hypothetical protein